MPNTVLLIKDQRACQRFRRCETLYSSTNKGSKTMYVGDVESGVCGFYTTVYTEKSYSCQRC